MPTKPGQRADDAPRTPTVSGWRRPVGVVLFVLHLILPLIALVLVPILGLPSGTNAIIMGVSVVGGPDVLLIVAIAILGKDGVSELMAKFGSVVRRVTKWDAVTERRYKVGMWVLVASMVLPTIILFFWHSSIEGIEGQPGWGFWVLLASTFAFIGAVLCMGQPFWLRIQAIASWDAQITIPTTDDAPAD
ncbi:MAG: hypothetical protein ACR2QK_01750 [Acidimicrobiales bacterium]